MRILVIEDDQKLAGLLQRGLVEHGHAVDVIVSAQRAGNSRTAIASVRDTGWPLSPVPAAVSGEQRHWHSARLAPTWRCSHARLRP